MDLVKWLLVLTALWIEGGEGGGHGHHHDHLKIHIPEFIHHDHHTKVITIHHHHHKPKEHHHHHHHHHHKPHHHIPYGHHYHHTKKSHHTTKGHSTTKSHGHHGHHGQHGHGHHGHHGHHGNHGHGHHGHGHHHHDFPSVNYDPVTVGFEEEYGTYTPPIASSDPGIPQVHGIQHTVKHVNVYDSLPGVIPSIPTSNGHSGGYQVTEEADEDDSFSSLNGIEQTYPATYTYLRGASPETSYDPFAPLSPSSTIQSQGYDPFATVAQPTAALASVESFTGIVQNDPFASSAPTSKGVTGELPVQFQGEGFDNPGNSFNGDIGSTPLLSVDEVAGTDDTPVSYHRVAGIQQVIKTGGTEVVTY